MDTVNDLELITTILLQDLLIKRHKTQIHLKCTAAKETTETTETQTASADPSDLEVVVADDHSFANTQRHLISCNNNNNTRSPTRWCCQHTKKARLSYSCLTTRKRFALVVYVLSEVHELFLQQTYCTYRELYYKNKALCSSQLQVTDAVKDVCCVLQQTAWNCGIFSTSKGLIAGSLFIHMSNGDVLDCNVIKGGTLIPTNFTYIEQLVTNAKFVLLVEKDTVFEKLIAHHIFSLIAEQIILVTAKGYPDIATRWLLHKLWKDKGLSIYALVDADPYGIDIMMIYRYGSFKALNRADLCCPQLKWLGIHPSDVKHFGNEVTTEPLTLNDYKKLEFLLLRQYISMELRSELLLLKEQKVKMEIDNMSAYTFSVFISDYIVNKIKRNVTL